MKWCHLGNLHLWSRAKHLTGGLHTRRDSGPTWYICAFGLFASIVKGKTPNRRSAHETRKRTHSVRTCSSLTNLVVSLRVSCIFVHCVVCNRRQRDFLRIVGSSVVHSLSGQARQGEKPCVSYLRRAELSSQIRQRSNSYKSYRQGYREGEFSSDGAAGENLCGALRTAVAVFARRMCTDWCKSLSQSLKSVSTIGGGGDTTIPSPGRSSKQPLPGVGLYNPLHCRQGSLDFSSFHQGVGQTSHGKGYFRAVSSQNGDKFVTPPPPPIVEVLSNTIRSRHTKPSSSPNCSQSGMWELGRYCSWN